MNNILFSEEVHGIINQRFVKGPRILSEGFMKRFTVLILMSMLLLFAGCGSENDLGSIPVPETFDSPESIVEFMTERNEVYLSTAANDGDISPEIRAETAEIGQSPYATVITCSDSRVPPEHIFQAGISELFVIRTAGNVVGEFELGSVEYGAEHLGTGLILVLGHTGCGAVDATLSGGGHGHVASITDEIASCLPNNCSASEAEIQNVHNSISKIHESHVIQELEADGEVVVMGAIYDIATGEVRWLE